MLGKFKNWLGIEGVKVELIIPEEIKQEDGFVDGRIVFRSKHAQTVSEVHIHISEKYSRGRGKDLKVDEYEIGRISKIEKMDIPPHKEVFIDFALPFELDKSSMDEFGDKNILTKGLAKAAKLVQNVKSQYKVTATAKIKGTALDPFDEKWIKIE